jgi:hypothetical protein
MAAPPPAAASTVHSATYGTPGVSFGFVPPLDPALTLGRPGDERLAFVTPVSGEVPIVAEAATGPIDFGRPALVKEFLSLSWNAHTARDAFFLVSYSVSGGAWLPAVGGGGFEIPDGTHGRTIAFRVWMTTSDVTATPAFDDLTIEWARWTGKPTKPAGDGSGVSHKPNAGHNGGSGVYTYPSGQQAPAQPSGAGPAPSGSGASSVGYGAGTGAGTGAASAASARGAATASQTTAGAASASSAVPGPPVQSSGEGDAVAVTGVAADSGQVVSGVPYEPVGGGPAAGGSPPGGARSGVSVPVLLISCVVVVLAVVLFGPWLVTAASLRRYTGYDARRARAGGPFGRVAR